MALKKVETLKPCFSYSFRWISRVFYFILQKKKTPKTKNFIFWEPANKDRCIRQDSHFGGKSVSFLFPQCLWGRTLWCSQAESHNLHFGNRNKTRTGLEMGPGLENKTRHTHTHTHTRTHTHKMRVSQAKYWARLMQRFMTIVCCFENWWLGAEDAPTAISRIHWHRLHTAGCSKESGTSKWSPPCRFGDTLHMFFQ